MTLATPITESGNFRHNCWHQSERLSFTGWDQRQVDTMRHLKELISFYVTVCHAEFIRVLPLYTP